MPGSQTRNSAILCSLQLLAATVCSGRVHVEWQLSREPPQDPMDPHQGSKDVPRPELLSPTPLLLKVDLGLVGAAAGT